MKKEIEIYEHILSLTKEAKDLKELEMWLSRERNLLKCRISKFDFS